MGSECLVDQKPWWHMATFEVFCCKSWILAIVRIESNGLSKGQCKCYIFIHVHACKGCIFIHVLRFCRVYSVMTFMFIDPNFEADEFALISFQVLADFRAVVFLE